MMTKVWVELLQRVQSWPEDAQDALAQVASEIQAELNKTGYRATPSELEGVDRGLRDSAVANFATQEQVEAVFAKYRR